MPKIKEVNAADKDTSFSLKIATGSRERTVLRKNIVGFCNYPLHRGWLTKNVANAHGCYGKQCSALIKIDNPYWDELENAEKIREEKLQRRQEERAAMKELPLEQQILCFAQKEAVRLKLDIDLQRASLKEDKKQCILYYMSNNLYEDQGIYSKICSNVFKKYGILCTLRKANAVELTEVMFRTARRMEEEGRFTEEDVQERKFNLPNPEEYTYLNLLSNLTTKTFVKKKTVVGFCSKEKHRGWIVIKEADHHQCAERNCPYLKRLNHPYWGEVVPTDMIAIDYQQASADQADTQKRIVQEVQDMFAALSKRLGIYAQLVRVQYLWDEYKYYQIEYVSELEHDDTPTYSDICNTIYKKYHVCCVLKKLTGLEEMNELDEDSFAQQIPTTESVSAVETVETSAEQESQEVQETAFAEESSPVETAAEILQNADKQNLPDQTPETKSEPEKKNPLKDYITRILILLAILLAIAYFILYNTAPY